jgi:hypothetical protein
VVQVAEVLVESVCSRQVLVQVPEVVLAELTRRVAQRFEALGDRRILGLQPDVNAGEADLGQTRAIDALARDERRPAGGAALLTVGIGEAHTFVGDAVNVRGAIAHQAIAVATEIGDSDVVAPDDENVGLSVGHDRSLSIDVNIEA